MEQKEIMKRIAIIDSETTFLRTILQMLEETDLTTALPNYEQIVMEAAVLSEKIACDFRCIVYSTAGAKKNDFMARVTESHNIRIEYIDGIFTVMLPSLLPKKKKLKNSDFLFDSLYYALDRYFSVNHIERFAECVVCFTHIYSEKTPSRYIKDHDNIETKQDVDVISWYVMRDDSGRYCDTFNSSRYGERDCTCIEVMSRNTFEKWCLDDKRRVEKPHGVFGENGQK